MTVNIIRVILIVIGAVMLIWFAIPAVFLNVFNSGNIVGMIAALVVLSYGIWMRGINGGIVGMWQGTAGKIFLIIAALLAAAVLMFVIISTRMMIIVANDKPDGDTTVVVLGCQVHPWGPSVMLEDRLIAAYDYLSENPDVKCILSGGQGENEVMSEAQCMYDWLAEIGIDKDRMYMEDKSTTTRENLEFSRGIIEREGLCPVITIITNDFHQYRASLIARSLGIICNNISAKSPLTMLPTYYVRELGGILYEIAGVN